MITKGEIKFFRTKRCFKIKRKREEKKKKGGEKEAIPLPSALPSILNRVKLCFGSNSLKGALLGINCACTEHPRCYCCWPSRQIISLMPLLYIMVCSCFHLQHQRPFVRGFSPPPFFSLQMQGHPCSTTRFQLNPSAVYFSQGSEGWRWQRLFNAASRRTYSWMRLEHPEL